MQTIKKKHSNTIVAITYDTLHYISTHSARHFWLRNVIKSITIVTDRYLFLGGLLCAQRSSYFHPPNQWQDETTGIETNIS